MVMDKVFKALGNPTRKGILRADGAGVVALVSGCVLWLFAYSYLVWRADPEKTREARSRLALR